MSTTWRELREAERDARSHVEKGTGLSDDAVKRICRVLLEVVLTSDDAMKALEAKLRNQGDADVLALDVKRSGK